MVRRRLLAALALFLVALYLGMNIGAGRDPPPAEATPPPPPSGVELWQTLPAELLANVAEGIQEHIADLQDDLEAVQAIQRDKLAENR